MSDVTISDRQHTLVERAASGDMAALQELLLHYHPRLLRRIACRLPLHLQPYVSVEDVAQEVYVVAFKKVTSFDARRPDRFFAWLGAIARNKVHDARRGAYTLKRGGGLRPLPSGRTDDELGPLDLLEMLAVHSRTPSRCIAHREQMEAVHAALCRLPPRQREVLTLRFIEQLPVADVAARINRSPGAVHMLTHRGLQRLGRELSQSTCIA
jgi:RNA polymerase sigma-70 factor (ECF subfamily)